MILIEADPYPRYIHLNHVCGAPFFVDIYSS